MTIISKTFSYFTVCCFVQHSISPPHISHSLKVGIYHINLHQIMIQDVQLVPNLLHYNQSERIVTHCKYSVSPRVSQEVQVLYLWEDCGCYLTHKQYCIMSQTFYIMFLIVTAHLIIDKTSSMWTVPVFISLNSHWSRNIIEECNPF